MHGNNAEKNQTLSDNFEGKKEEIKIADQSFEGEIPIIEDPKEKSNIRRIEHHLDVN